MSAVVALPTALTLHLAADARQKRKERLLAGYLAQKGIRIPVREHTCREGAAPRFGAKKATESAF